MTNLLQPRDIEAIKARHPVEQVVASLGVELHRSGNVYKARCPFHGGKKKTTFVVYPDTQTWKCHGRCDDGGDVISFIQKRQGIGFTDAIHYLEGEPVRATVRHFEPAPEPEPIAETEVTYPFDLRDIEAWRHNYHYHQQAWNYVNSRVATTYPVDMTWVGWTGNDDRTYSDMLVIPYWASDLETLEGYKLLSINKKNGKRFFRMFGRGYDPFLFGFVMKQSYNRDVVFMTEGELDAMLVSSLTSRLLNCFAANVGSLTERQIAKLIALECRFVVLADNDEAGVRAAQEIQEKMWRAEVVFCPDEFKDIGDFYQADRSGAAAWLRELL